MGDRFVSAESELRFRHPLVENRWSVGLAGYFYGIKYDLPDPAYFHNMIPRGELNLRYESFPDWTVTSRLQMEVLRVPQGGGLGEPTLAADAFNVVREEYNQLAARFDIERFGGGSWIFLSPGFGRRTYRAFSRLEDDLLARSNYWFAQVNTFAETTLGRFMKLRVSADLLHERHDFDSDDLTSIYFATELRYALIR